MVEIEPLLSEAELSRCDDEPIHIPDAIQPHGVLLALREPELIVAQVSANIAEAFACPPEAILGRALGELLPGAQVAALRAALAAKGPLQPYPLRVEVGGRVFDGITHRHRGATLLELEPAAPASPQREALLGRAVDRLGRASDLQSLCEAAVGEVSALTGFERVMLYRFDEDGHGAVIAEAHAEGLEPYLGLHYPASDIPRQARELYRLNWLRLIPDAAYHPVPLVPLRRPDTGEPLDLSFSVLRSVSPVHREYLRNWGVRASMSISLLRGTELWGLVACVHRAPRFVPYELRLTCEALGRLLSLQIAAREEVERRQLREALRATGDRLIAAMRAADGDVLAALMRCPDDLLALVGASGAAIDTGGEIRTAGRVPAAAELAALFDWASQEKGGAALQTHALPTRYPPAAAYPDVASGLLAISLPKPAPSRLMWFRPEVVETVHWGGDPRKPAELEPGARRLHPRRSFARWREILRGRARRWRSAELEVADDLRRAAIELDLARQVSREQAAVRARDDLVAVVSHDLRNPLGVIQIQTALILRALGQKTDEPARRLQSAIERIRHAGARMDTLLQDLLDLSKIEAGRFTVSPEPHEPTALLDEALALMAPLANQKSLSLSHRAEELPPVLADPERIFQVLSNLIGNAIKFTPEGGRIEVEARRVGDAVEFLVRDTGPGIPEEQHARIFERYWQAQAGSRAGTGLGLYIAQGIVKAHGGRLWVESAPGAGSTFRFTLPLA